jgi:putative hydrolase of the HAD superfamily
VTGRAPRAVSFDFGQTLAELDTAMLSRRLRERGVAVASARLEAAVPEAWTTYDAAIRAGAGGHPWKILMARLLDLAGTPGDRVGDLVDWLWTEQPVENLWRRPIPGMIEIARELAAASVPLALLSNSEGRIAELADELGWLELFPVIADSGRLGIEKPDPAIFAWTAERLGVGVGEVLHVGDSRAADVDGALRAGMHALWFRGDHRVDLGERGDVARDPAEVRAALVARGLLPAG